MDDQSPQPLSEAPAGSLRPVDSAARWTVPAAIGGALFLVVAVVLAFVAPSPLWFLLYPLLVVGAVAALTTVAAWLLRHF